MIRAVKANEEKQKSSPLALRADGNERINKWWRPFGWWCWRTPILWIFFTSTCEFVFLPWPWRRKPSEIESNRSVSVDNVACIDGVGFPFCLIENCCLRYRYKSWARTLSDVSEDLFACLPARPPSQWTVTNRSTPAATFRGNFCTSKKRWNQVRRSLKITKKKVRVDAELETWNSIPFAGILMKRRVGLLRFLFSSFMSIGNGELVRRKCLSLQWKWER